MTTWDNLPLYRQVIERILAAIESGELEPGTKLPSERALCEQFGVSQITVRRALRELAHMGRVQSRHGLGWFITKSEDKRPISVALIVMGQDFLLWHALQAVIQSLGEHCLFPQVFLCPEGKEKETCDYLDASEPHARLILAAGPVHSLAIRIQALVQGHEAASLILLRAPENVAVPSLILDEQDAAARATKHLIALGHRRIAYVGDNPTQTGGWQCYQGFTHAMWEAGLEIPFDWVLASREGAAEAGQLESIFGPSHHPSAVVCSSSLLAAAVIQWLEGFGLACPEHVAVVGLGDDALEPYLRPPLTTFRFDTGAWAQAVAQATHAILENRVPASQRFGGDLVIRASCAPIPNDKR